MSLCLQSPDLLSLIARHLRPRHLRLLLHTNKHVKKHVDNEHYWARVALHLVYREFGAMEIVDPWTPPLIFERLNGLYDLRNLKLGYAATMDVMEQRARHLHQEFEFENNASVQTMVLSGFNIIKNDPYGNHQKATRYLKDAPATMKGISKALVEGYQRDYVSRSMVHKFARDIDDDPALTYQMKAFFMKKFNDLFRELPEYALEELQYLGHQFYE